MDLKKRTRSDSDTSDSNESLGSLVDFIVNEDQAVVKEDDASSDVHSTVDDIELLKEETKKLTEGLVSTIVNGRCLRSRDPKSLEARKPKDEYYERFGRQQEQQVMEKFTKKDIIDYVLKLKTEYKSAYEESGQTWPTLSMKMSLEKIQEEYKKIKEFANLPESDVEDDDDDLDLQNDEDEDVVADDDKIEEESFDEDVESSEDEEEEDDELSEESSDESSDDDA